MTLVCGGRGPCCHVGYAHRHCEHCDVVIPTHVFYPNYGWNQPWYWQSTHSQLANTLQGQLTAQSAGLGDSLQALQAQVYSSEEYKP